MKARLGGKLDGADAVHLFRVPMGRNTKKKPDRKNYAVGPGERNPGNTLTASFGPSGPGSVSAASSGTLGLEALRELMAMVPNDLDRDGWIEVGHGLKALCENDDEGFEVFDAWSQLHDSYDTGKTRAAWDSFGASGLRTKGGLLRARAEGLDGEGFRKWEASVVFDDGAPPPPGPKTAGITATPFKWMDLAKTAPRDWLYGDIPSASSSR